MSDEPRSANTAEGQRKILEITVCDGSRTSGGLAKLTTALWFPTSSAGEASRESLRGAYEDKQPLSFFGLYVTPFESDKVICKTAKDLMRLACRDDCPVSSKSMVLRAHAAEYLQDTATVQLAAEDPWTPQEKKQVTVIAKPRK